MPITRPIWWNVPAWLVLALYLGATVALGVSAWVAARHALRWSRGRRLEAAHAVVLPRALARLLAEIFAHRRVFRDAHAGWAHLLIFYGFLVLFIGTVMVFVHDKLVPFLFGATYLVFSLVLDLAGVALLVGIGWALFRRARHAPPRLAQSLEAYGVSILLGLIGVTGFLVEASRIAATQPSFELWSVVGWSIARAMIALDLPATPLHRFLWGVHAALSCLFLALVTITFLRHLAVAPIQILLRERRRVGAVSPPPSSGRFATLVPDTLSRPQLLDASACVGCGRCTEVCPATAAGKPLDPRAVVQKTLAAMLAARPLEQAVSPAEAWACTTCAACVHACPFQIEVLDKLVDLRRLWVEQGAIDPSGARALEAIAERGNPFGAPPSERMTWAERLAIRTLRPGDRTSLLYWVGCAGAFDPAGRRTARSVAQLLSRAGVEFGVLGPAESCTGDPARRMGEEGLFTEAAGRLIETLGRVRFDRIVTHCAHCFHALANEYPALGSRYDVIHHSQLLAELVASGRLSAARDSGESVTFHDPCYLARHNGEYAAARKALAGLKLVEMPRNREGSFCCGAGGGGNWVEVREGQRIATLRMAEARATGASVVATGCPFCTIMLEGETADRGIAVRDLSELLLESQP